MNVVSANTLPEGQVPTGDDLKSILSRGVFALDGSGKGNSSSTTAPASSATDASQATAAALKADFSALEKAVNGGQSSSDSATTSPTTTRNKYHAGEFFHTTA